MRSILVIAPRGENSSPKMMMKMERFEATALSISQFDGRAKVSRCQLVIREGSCRQDEGIRSKYIDACAKSRGFDSCGCCEDGWRGESEVSAGSTSLFEVRLSIRFCGRRFSKGYHEAQHSFQTNVAVTAASSLGIDNFTSRSKAEELCASRSRISPNIQNIVFCSAPLLFPIILL